MKRLIGLLFIIVFSLTQGVLYAQTTATSSSQKITPTVVIGDKEIQNLKDKIATKVAELTKEKNNKALSGFATEVKGSIIKIKNENDEEYEIKPDDAISKYYQITGTAKKEIQYSDLKKEMFLIVTGVLNDKVITANTIYVDEMFLVKSGKVTEIDKENFTLKVLTTEKDTMTLEIETSTKQTLLNIKTSEVERSGFSKIKEGDTVHFVARKTGNEKDNKYPASKILIIPQEYFMK